MSLHLKKKEKQLLLILAVVGFILSLLPLFLIARYDHPSVDDYFYGFETRNVWEKTGSVPAVVSEAITQTRISYETWQGNFSAILLMRLMPAIFSEDAYRIVPFLLIGSFVLCTLIFSLVLLSRMGLGRKAAFVCGLLLGFLQLELVDTPSDSFFWYNGSIYYTFFYSLSLLLFSFLILGLSSRKNAALFWFFPALILSFIIGSGNFVTALFSFLVLAFFCVYLFFLKKRPGGKSLPLSFLIDRVSFVRLTLLCLCCLFMLSGLLLSITAPGNSIRQASVGGSHPVIASIALSFVYGGYALVSNLSLPVITGFLLLCPCLNRISGFLYQKGARFPLPGVVIPFFFCLYCTQGTPVFYAQGIALPSRIINIIGFQAYWFYAFSLIYLLGYLRRKQKDRENRLTCLTFGRALLLGCLLFVSLFGQIRILQGDGQDVSLSRMPTSISAAYSLVTGEAKAYDNAYRERLAALTDPMVADAVFSPLPRPHVLFHSDITPDVTNWRNLHMAIYYRKLTVRIN